jgi:hypothetical protein
VLVEMAMKFLPGDFATWHAGSAHPSWPPDGQWIDMKSSMEMLVLRENTPVLIIAKLSQDNHGVIVMIDDRVWWCSIASLQGISSGSAW